MVCGNKADLQGDRAVTTDQGLKWAKDHGLSFLETSAKNGNNVHQAFQIVLQGKISGYSFSLNFPASFSDDLIFFFSYRQPALYPIC